MAGINPGHRPARVRTLLPYWLRLSSSRRKRFHDGTGGCSSLAMLFPVLFCYARCLVQWRCHAHALFLFRAVRRRGQQRLWPEGFRVPAAHRLAVPARAHLRRLVGAARPVALHRRRRRDDRRQRHHHRPSHCQVSAHDRRETDRRGARYRPPDHPHARRPLLGNVVLALEGRAVLAAVRRRADAHASEPHTRRSAQGAGLQLPALLFSGNRALRSRRRLPARPKGFAGAGRPVARKRLPARRDADQHRRRHLWLHRQYPFLRHRYAAQAVRLRPRQPRAPLQRNSCGRDRAAARGTEVRMIGAASGSMLRQAAPCATLPATGAPMSHVTYRIVRHDEGWAYMVNGVFSEPFPTHDAALAAARTAAAEQRLRGHTETIEYEDDKGPGHTETAAGSDRPDTDVEDTN